MLREGTSKAWPCDPTTSCSVYPPFGRTGAEAETPLLWPPDAKKWLIGKDPDAEKDWRWEKKGMTEDEIVGWHHWHDGHEFEQAPKVGDGQGGLVCCSAWSCKGSETTEQLNWTDTVPCNFVWSYCFNAHLHAVEVWLCTSSYTSGENLDTVSLSNCLLVTATGMCSTGTQTSGLFVSFIPPQSHHFNISASSLTSKFRLHWAVFIPTTPSLTLLGG